MNEWRKRNASFFFNEQIWNMIVVTIHSSMKFPSSHVCLVVVGKPLLPTDRPKNTPVGQNKIWGPLFQIFATFLPRFQKKIIYIYICIYICIYIYKYMYISFQPSACFIIATPPNGGFKSLAQVVCVDGTCSALNNATWRSRRWPRKEPKEAENLNVDDVTSPKTPPPGSGGWDRQFQLVIQ